MTVNLSTIIQAQRKVLTEGPCTQCGERDRRLCDCTIKTEETKMSWDSKTMPSSCEARDFFPEQTIAQIGIGNIFGISGGRVAHLSKNGEVVGIELPVGHGYKVRVFLDADDTYVVQRVWRETVKGVATGVYCDEIGEVAYQAGMYQSNRDWGDS